MEEVVSPVGHRYVPPPEAEIVTMLPIQPLAPMAVALGSGFTVTVAVADLVQPFALVTVTVYVVVDEGLTVIAAVVAPVFHR